MLNNKIKLILDNFKNSNYDLYKIPKDKENRIDLILYDIYKSNNYIQYYQIFSYLNDIVYIQDEFIADRYLKVYNLDELYLILNSNNININEQIFF